MEYGQLQRLWDQFNDRIAKIGYGFVMEMEQSYCLGDNWQTHCNETEKRKEETILGSMIYVNLIESGNVWSFVERWVGIVHLFDLILELVLDFGV